MKYMTPSKIAAFLFLLLGLVACYPSETTITPVLSAQEQPQGQSSATTNTIFAKGEVVPLFDVMPSFQIGGRVVEVLVVEGDQVQRGDPLIRLNASDAELALRQAQAQLTTAQSSLAIAQAELQLAQAGVTTAEGKVTTAQAQLALVQAGPLPEEIAVARSHLAATEAAVTQALGDRDVLLTTTTQAQIDVAEADLAAAAAKRRALEEQYNAILTNCYTSDAGVEVCPQYGPVEENARAELEAAQASEHAAQLVLDQRQAGPTIAEQYAANGIVTVALAKRDAAQAQLDLLLADTLPEQIAIAEIGVSQAQTEVRMAEVNVMEAAAAVQQAETIVAVAQADIDTAQVVLERMTLKAPTNGVVIQVDTNPGEFVRAGEPVLTLADLSGWQVKTTDLTELDVAHIESNTRVQINFDAIPGSMVEGTITDIALLPGFDKGAITYEVIVRLDTVSDLPLRWGMTAFINIP